MLRIGRILTYIPACVALGPVEDWSLDLLLALDVCAIHLLNESPAIIQAKALKNVLG